MKVVRSKQPLTSQTEAIITSTEDRREGVCAGVSVCRRDQELIIGVQVYVFVCGCVCVSLNCCLMDRVDCVRFCDGMCVSAQGVCAAEIVISWSI